MIVEVTQAMRNDAEKLASRICGCANNDQHRADVKAILEVICRHRIANQPQPTTAEIAQPSGADYEAMAAGYILQSGKRVHRSDCATSCAPAMKPGPCDCDVIDDLQPITAEIVSQEVVERVARAMLDGIENGGCLSDFLDSLNDFPERALSKLAEFALTALPATAALMADNARLAEAKSEAWERAQRVKAPEDAEILAICERIGFGAVMDSASRQWILRDPIGAFYIGGCLSKQEGA